MRQFDTKRHALVSCVCGGVVQACFRLKEDIRMHAAILSIAHLSSFRITGKVRRVT